MDFDPDRPPDEAAAAGSFSFRLVRRCATLLKIAAMTTVLAIPAYVVMHQTDVDPGSLLTVRPGVFALEMQASGLVEPRRSERVTSQCEWTTRILNLVPEGTYVQTGDIVCVLDSSLLEDYRRIRELRLIRARAELDVAVQNELLTQAASERRLTEAEFRRQAATGRLEEYELGAYPQELDRTGEDLRLLESRFQAAQQEFENTERMWALGFVTRQALETASRDMAAKEEELRRAKAGRFMLTRFSHPRNELELRFSREHAEREVLQQEALSSLAETQARLDRISNERRAKILTDRVDAIRRDIAACTVRAPRDGQIIFANSWEDLSRGRRTVEEGRSIHFRQPLFEIVDDSDRVVRAPLPEALITRVSVGMPVRVQLKSYETDLIAGEILEIPEYSRPRNDFTPDLRDYWVSVLLKPTSDQRPKVRLQMDATVTFELSKQTNAIVIPREAIAGRAGFSCVWVLQGGRLVPRAVAVGEIHESRACIRAGLEPGEQVVVQLTPGRRAALEQHVDQMLTPGRQD